MKNWEALWRSLFDWLAEDPDSSLTAYEVQAKMDEIESEAVPRGKKWPKI